MRQKYGIFLFGNPFVATQVAAIHPGVHFIYEYIIKSAWCICDILLLFQYRNEKEHS